MQYQEVEIYDEFLYQIMPSEIKTFLEASCSLSKSGHLSKGQGYDFVLEEENKNVKASLKRGVPTEKVWLSTCRNFQSLKRIKSMVLDLTGQAASEGSDRETNLDDAIKEWKLRVRILDM